MERAEKSDFFFLLASFCAMRIMMLMMMMILIRSRLHMVLFDFPSSHTLQEHQKENEHTQFRSATG